MSKEQTNTKKLVLTAILTAIIVLMSFTPLGYLKAGAIEISFIPIPVVIGAIVLGPVGGAILGGVFGITSFIQCFGLSTFGATLLNINPVYTFILCLIPRILMGWLCGVAFKIVAKFDKTKLVSYGAASLIGPILNTIFFMAGLILLFGKTEFIMQIRGAKSVLGFAIAFVGINGLIEAAATFVVGFGIAKALTRSRKDQPDKK